MCSRSPRSDLLRHDRLEAADPPHAGSSDSSSRDATRRDATRRPRDSPRNGRPTRATPRPPSRGRAPRSRRAPRRHPHRRRRRRAATPRAAAAVPCTLRRARAAAQGGWWRAEWVVACGVGGGVRGGWRRVEAGSTKNKQTAERATAASRPAESRLSDALRKKRARAPLNRHVSATRFEKTRARAPRNRHVTVTTARTARSRTTRPATCARSARG